MYKINVDSTDMQQLQEVTLTQEELAERYDLQEWIAKHPECLGEDLLVIQKEFSGWDRQSRKRLDLLALDKNGNVVVIENKRDDSTYDVVAQAITYASFCSTMTVERIVQEYARYLSDAEMQGAGNSPEERICRFLGVQQLDELPLNQRQRIVLVAGDYPIEVTSAALWLRTAHVDVSCVTYKLYKDRESLFIDFDRIIPTVGAEEYQVRLEGRRASEDAASAESRQCNPDYREYWTRLNDYLGQHPDLAELGLVANENNARRGFQYYDFSMTGHDYNIALRLYGKKGQVGVAFAFNTADDDSAALYQRVCEDDVRTRIEEAFGSSVLWAERSLRTISARSNWDRTDPENSIEWQISTVRRVKDIIDSLEE